MESQIKCVLLYPPQWLPFNPHLAPATIQSILRNNGYEVYLRDLNIEFYNTVLKPNYIAASLQRAVNNYNANSKQIFEQFTTAQQPLKEFPSDFQRKFTRYREIAKVVQANEYPYILNNVEKAFNVLRSKEDYYNLHLVEWALTTITKAADILSSIYYPSHVNFYKVFATSYNNFETIRDHCLDREGNIFFEYYWGILPQIIGQNADYIGKPI